MEHAIIHSDLESEAIKPSKLVQQFLRHVSDYNRDRHQTEKLSFVACPACDSKTIRKAFVKLGLQYLSCAACRTIYVSPRPTQKELRQYFVESEARQFWLRDIWGETANARRSKILEPFFDWVQVFVEQYFSNRSIDVAEVYPIHWGLWEMWQEKRWSGNYFLVEPYFPESLAPKSLASLCLPFSTPRKFDVICLPDTLAWVAEPRSFFPWILEHLNPKGICFVTTIFSTGFDVMMLKEQASYFVPPERLNLFSLEIFQNLIQQFSFEVLECSTPGVLDMQNVYDAYCKNNVVLPDFIQYLFGLRGRQSSMDSFQDFLQGSRLSSQGRVVLQKT